MEALGFLLKKIISRLFFPVGLVLGLGLAGGLLVWLHPRRRLGPALLLAAWLLLWLLSWPPVSFCLLAGLEDHAGPYADPARLAALGVRQVVVLGGGLGQGELTSADRLNDASLKRLMEGIRLWRELPQASLVLSGGDFSHAIGIGRAMHALALEMGVPAEAICLETESWDTEDEARVLAPRLGREPFALVTSAFHMRRSLTFFRAYGLRPIPAPADFRARSLPRDHQAWLPNAGALWGSETACYEYLGWWWLNLKALFGRGPAPAGAGG
ncbi:MAG: YdcF family protein [Thermodesulfobacteriota bacterium]